MLIPPTHYNVVECGEEVDGAAVLGRLLDFATTPAAVPLMLGQMRPVILSGPATATPLVLYLSDGALRVAESLKLGLVVQARLPREECPKGLALILGENSDRR